MNLLVTALAIFCLYKTHSCDEQRWRIYHGGAVVAEGKRSAVTQGEAEGKFASN